MTHKVGPKGQVVIPKDLRDELGITPGSEVNFIRHENGVVVRPSSSIKHLGGMFKGGGNMAARLLEDRAREPK